MKIQPIESALTVSLVGDVYHLLLGAADTGGAFDLVHSIVPPGGGPPLHTHTREDETFFVLEGEVTFIREGRETAAGPGTAIFLERGVAHRFENRTGSAARMLVQTAPAGLERMLRDAGTPLAPGAAEPLPMGEGGIERLLAACERAGIVIHR